MKKELLALLSGLLISSALHAQTATYTSSVQKVSVSHHNTNGGCIVKTSINPKNKLASCKAFWVAMSCNGTHNAKDTAYRMIDIAQMSLALGKNVSITIRDDKLHNGYCVVKRIDIIE